jgi:dUTP pyrophosphatase
MLYLYYSDMKNHITLSFKKLRTDAKIPAYQTPGSAGFDLSYSPDPAGEYNAGVKISPGKIAIIPTGLITMIPEGYEMQIRPRSGLAAKNGITVNNAPGTVDSDYRGEIKVILINHSDTPFFLYPGDRIAQGVISAVVQPTIVEVDEVDSTERGAGGLGSTGRA